MLSSGDPSAVTLSSLGAVRLTCYGATPFTRAGQLAIDFSRWLLPWRCIILGCWLLLSCWLPPRCSALGCWLFLCC